MMSAEKQINDIIKKISEHPKMRDIAISTLYIMDKEERYPITLFGIQENIKDIVQDIRGINPLIKSTK